MAEQGNAGGKFCKQQHNGCRCKRDKEPYKQKSVQSHLINRKHNKRHKHDEFHDMPEQSYFLSAFLTDALPVFFIALAAASIVLLLAGLIRAFRKKRAGIMILVSLIGIIGCIAWFIFLVSSKLI